MFPSDHASARDNTPRFAAKRPAAKPQTPKGHEAFLKALEGSGASVIVEMVDGSSLTGSVKHSDKYTISLKVDKQEGGYQVYVIFKHAITLFYTPGIAATKTEAGTEA